MDREAQPSGGIIFQLQETTNFFKMELPKKASSDWHHWWLYVKERMPEGEIVMHNIRRSRACRIV
jgi:hypothetical protein